MVTRYAQHKFATTPFPDIMSFLIMPKRSSFSVYYKAALVVPNSLSTCLSIKLLISLSNLNESLAEESFLSCKLFAFVTLIMPLP